MPSSIESSPEVRLERRTIWLLGLGGCIAAVLYLLAAWHETGLGFPLDDSWIHLAYARNLAELGQWALLPGQPSAASTAPLWTAMLAPGFLIHLGPHIWTYLLGIGCLIGTGVVTERIVRAQAPGYKPRIPWAGLLMVTEWHLVWAAVSGMETLLFILLVLLIFGMLLQRSPNYLGMGVLIGLSLWVRPDGLTMLAPAALAAFLAGGGLWLRVRRLMLLAGGFAALLLPYILMNLVLAGRPFPNTFYAKQAEYLAWRLSAPAVKLEDFSLVFLGGVALVLLPAVIAEAVRSVRSRSWPGLLALGWAAGYAWLYTSRLPVYQHGRYVMPAMVIYILLGLIFLAQWLPSVRTRVERLLRFAWLSAVAVLSAVFYFYGMTVYATDVTHIERELVASARWIAANVPDGGLVAAHDIGALGYFAPKIRLIDLAGLASPEVVPFINDEQKLASYLDSRKAEYLVAYPFHSPQLARIGRPVFAAAASGDLSSDHAIVVYRWPTQ